MLLGITILPDASASITSAIHTTYEFYGKMAYNPMLCNLSDQSCACSKWRKEP
jgi:hypothetical protein